MNSGQWAAIGAMIAGVAALVALYFAWRSSQQAARSARAAEEQTEIQRQLRKDAAQPYVWADIRMDDATGFLLNVVVGNSGPTVAQKVRIKFDPPLLGVSGSDPAVKAAHTVLTDGIESLPPGRVMQWNLGGAPQLLSDNNVPRSYKITVTARGPFGAIPALTYIVNLANWKQTLARPSGNLYQLTKAVDDLTKAVAARPKNNIRPFDPRSLIR